MLYRSITLVITFLYLVKLSFAFRSKGIHRSTVLQAVLEHIAELRRAIMKGRCLGEKTTLTLPPVALGMGIYENMCGMGIARQVSYEFFTNNS